MTLGNIKQMFNYTTFEANAPNGSKMSVCSVKDTSHVFYQYFRALIFQSVSFFDQPFWSYSSVLRQIHLLNTKWPWSIKVKLQKYPATNSHEIPPQAQIAITLAVRLVALGIITIFHIPILTRPPLRSTVVRASARGAGGRGSIPDSVTPKT